MSAGAIQSVLVLGGGLAGWLAALSLRSALSPDLRITVLETEAQPAADALYGFVLPPSAYKTHLALGISEPDLMLATATTFAFGHAFESWADTARSWVQAFHAPLPVLEGVSLHKLANRSGGLQALLVSAAAAKRGVFAHPPEDPSHPLSKAEYGYAVDPAELAEFYKRLALRRGVTVVSGEVESVRRDGDTVQAVALASGQAFQADLFIDASGPDARIGEARTPGRKIAFRVQRSAPRGSGAPLARVLSDDKGWTSAVTLRSGELAVTVRSDDKGGTVVETGRAESAWRGNVLAIGQAAWTLEPLTLAPIKGLLADIDRMVRLFPNSSDMRIEARDYNAAWRDDTTHAALFHQAHFADVPLPDGPYWTAAAGERDPKLERKLIQYAARGHLVSYDYEPFDDGDWAVLHDGIGRRPMRRDALADNADRARVEARLSQLRADVAAVIAKMPPHPVYLTKFLSYLQRRPA